MLAHKRQLAVFFLLSCIVVFGLWIRVFNTQYAKNVDEPNVNSRAAEIASGHLHIRWYNWPGQSLMRLNAVPYKIRTEYLNRKTGEQRSTVEWYALQPEQYNTISHIFSALFSTLTIILVFALGRTLYNDWAGLAGALFFSVSYLSVLHAHFGSPDSIVTAMVTATVLGSVLLRQALYAQDQRKAWRYAVITGACVGFGFATKYTAAITVVPLLLVVGEYVWAHKKDYQKGIRISARVLFFALIAAFIMHLLWNPFFLFDIRLILRDVAQEAAGNRIGVDWGGKGFVFFRNFFFYATQLFSWSGLLITLFAYATLVAGYFFLKEKKSEFLILSLYSLSIILFLSALKLHWSRWGLPLTPLVAVAAGIAVAHCYRLLCRLTTIPLLRLAMSVVLVSVCTFPQLAWSVQNTRMLSYKDTDAVLSEYVQQQIPEGSTIVADTYYLAPGDAWTVDQKRITVYGQTLSEQRAAGVDYVVIRPDRYQRAVRQPELYQSMIAYIDSLRATGDPLIEVKKNCGARVEALNDIEVYQWIYRHGFSAMQEPCVLGTSLELYSIK